MPPSGRKLIALEKSDSTHDRYLFANHPIFERNITFYLRIKGLSIWIIHENPPATVTQHERQAIFFVCRGIAYWLKEIAPSISSDLIKLRRFCKELELRVTSAERDAADDESPDTMRVPPWFTLQAPAIGVWRLQVYSTASIALSGPTNVGERDLIRRLVTCLLRLSAGDGTLDHSRISNIVDHHAPFGNKR